MSSKTSTVYAIGECMVEFARLSSSAFRRSFAGDVYNTAVYLKRLAPAHCSVEFMTAVGDDSVSAAMMAAWREEGISSNHVARLPGKSPGLYVIDTDEIGERSFSYWRSASAAKELTVSLKRFDFDCLSQDDVVYYSGITIAILNERNRRALFAFVKEAKKRGALIAFDPNYRPTLWESRETAAQATMNAYGLADIVLTGAEEEANVFGWSSDNSELAELQRIGVKEAILKSGERGIFGICGGERFHTPFKPAAQVLDTTAAGDSFAGAYLAFRIGGLSPKNATQQAAKIASIVVSHPGAVIDRDLFFREIEKDARLLESATHVDQ